jgi:hypothetical protein
MNFDLNIANYTKDELREMFGLPPNFDETMFDKKESKLRDTIINNKDISKDTQSNILNFLLKSKYMLLNNSSGSNLNKGVNILEKIYNTSFDLKPTELKDANEHMVQQRRDHPYLSSYPSQYFPGIINPLKRKITNMNLNVDSKFRDSYYSTSSANFMVNIPMNITDVISMKLSAIELPTTFYNISKQFGSNFFSITLTDTGETKVVTILDGNYTDVGIINSINNQLLLLGGDFANIVFIININNNSGSGQTMVGCDTTVTPFTFELNFQTDKYGNEDSNTPLPLKLGWILGFRNGKYINNQNYVSESIVNTNGMNYVYLVIDDHNNSVSNSFYSVFNSSLLNKNILARISLQAKTFEILFQNNLNLVTPEREYFGPVNINNFTVQLLDAYGRIVDMNNMDFSFCLTLTRAYDI